LLDYGKQLFTANWTIQDGQGRPFAKGVGTPAPLSDSSSPLVFPRNFNRFSTPDANSCAGCHNVPNPGGAGDFVANVFVLAQRFDSITMDHSDPIMTRGALDERGNFVDVLTVANSRATTGMFGAGYLELLAREITADLRAIASTIQTGQSAALVSKGISFGRLARKSDGVWDTSAVSGLPPQALNSSGAANPPSLILQPWHQVGNVVSLRQFTTNAFHHHHGMQAEERFGAGVDQDGDGLIDELTRADITAATLFQAARRDKSRNGTDQRQHQCGQRQHHRLATLRLYSHRVGTVHSHRRNPQRAFTLVINWSCFKRPLARFHSVRSRLEPCAAHLRCTMAARSGPPSCLAR
jgi:hypothetical protein